MSGDAHLHQFDTSALFGEIDQFSAEFDEWCEAQMKDHISNKQSYISAEQKNRAAVHQLLNAKSNFESQAKQLDNEIKKQESLLKDLQKSLDKLKLEESVLTPHVEVAAAEKATRQLSLAEEKERFNRKMAQHRMRQAELARGVDMYQKRLGLEFRRNNSTIQVIFTQVDPRDPERPFSFTFRITDDIYELTACEPRLSGLRPLVTELNASPLNFQRFVINMRQKFQALVRQ
ncbi:MAG: hypothetical protein Q8P67_02315 [archaeon]|nr:hypothetical protein [archaeon]